MKLWLKRAFCATTLVLVAYVWLSGQSRSPHRIPHDIAREVVYDEEVVDVRHPEMRSKPIAGNGIDDHSDDFDIERKRQDVIQLVDRAVSFLKQEPGRDQAFHRFTHTNEFKMGELYIFVFDLQGNCFAHGLDSHLVWKNLYNLRDAFGSLIVQGILKKAKEGGGWVTYEWRGSIKVSYVRQITISGKTYIIGAGYYPHSKDDSVVVLVKGAAAHFNDMMRLNRPIEEAFSTITYPKGRFVRGDLYLYALDFSGNTVAHGERPGLIGTNAWNYRDSRGVFVNQEIVRKLQDQPGGIWIEYISKNAVKRAYAEQVTDNNGNRYFISCGYYPDADRRKIEDLVRKGYKYMKTNGPSKASNLFSDKRESEFRYGDLYLFVYDMNGKCIAHGGNPEFIGSNQYDLQNEDGVFYIREMIAKAQAGGGWINYRDKNLFQSVYVEPVDLGVNRYFIGSGLFPVSKSETMALLVKTAASFLETRTEEEAFREFTNVQGSLIRGDLFVFAFDTEGICYAYGDNYDVIWRNFLNDKDDNGQPYIQVLINTVKFGPGKVTFSINGAPAVAFVQEVRKNGRSYIVGARYFK